MKKSLLTLAVVGGMLLTSCSNDEVAAPAGDGNVTFNVSLPSNMQSRAFSDGLSATNVKCYVYDKTRTDMVAPILTETIDMKGTLKGELTLNLITGRKYDFVFVAVADDKKVVYNPNDKTIDVKYSTPFSSNDESLDAFYNTVQEFTVKGASEQNVELRRPYAQLNIGTDDILDYCKALNGADATKSDMRAVGVKVTNVYSQFNLLKGEVQGPASDVTFSSTTVPSGETFPVTSADAKKPYEYLAMNYLLVPSTKDMVDVTMTVGVNPADKFEYANVPLQRNYRTNIYGSLLTDPTKFNVEIKPEYEKPDYEYVVSTVSELSEAIANGGSIRMEADLELPANTTFAATEPTKVNLAGHTLSIPNTTPVDNTNLTFANGTIDSKLSDAAVGNLKVALEVKGNSTLTLNGVDLTCNSVGIGAYNKDIDQVVINVENSKIQGKWYGFSTNAEVSEDHKPVFNFTNCEITATHVAAVLVNIPCTATFKNCTINGSTHGVIARGGNVTLEGCTINQNVETYAKEFNNGETAIRGWLEKDWKDGSYVAPAGVVIGNRSNAYQYPTVVKMTDCEVTATQYNGNRYDAVYVWANQGENLGVTFDYTNCTFSPADPFYGSANIKVNGEDATISTRE